LTLEEIRARLKSEKRLKTGTTSVWRFYERHDITFKKTLYAAEQDRPDVAAARAELKTEQSKLEAPRLVFIDETAVTTKMGIAAAHHGASVSLQACRTVTGRRCAHCRATHQWLDGALRH